MKSLLEKNKNVFGKNVIAAKLSRRGFIKAGGILAVGIQFVGPELARGDAPPAPKHAPTPGNTLNPTLSGSWIEIHPDNTVLIRTGKVDFGQGSIFTAYRQIVADELDVAVDAIKTVVTGDTDRTPDGGGSFGFLVDGTPNLRKAAGYTRQALLDLAAEQLGVAKDKLTVKDGIVSGGGKSISFGELVKDKQLKLTIPVSGDIQGFMGLTVEGNPPLKTVSEYKVVGTSFNNPATRARVTAKADWVTDVRLPGMLHGRVVHPETLGSTLIAAGEVDKKQFPNTQLVVKGNLVGVVAPSEWEAVQAAMDVAGKTKWTEWKGLPGDAKLQDHLRNDMDWASTPVMKGEANKGNVEPVLATAEKKLTATYQMPYMKHVPIGPTVAVGDVKADGTVWLHVHNQNPQQLRKQIAMMLGTTVDHVIVRSYAGPGHYGRSNGGNSGAEDEAVILSQAVGKPVRVQWMRADDLQWSTQSSAAFADVQLAIDDKGKMAAYEIVHHMPAMQDDRLVGAVIAGLATQPAPDPKGDFVASTVNAVQDPWVYAQVANVDEKGKGTYQVGQKASPIAAGLRNHSMRTPGQFQQNFPREVAINEAAALAGADAIQFRIDHLSEKRAISVLEAVRKAHGWETRPSPSADAKNVGANVVRGRGVSLMLRSAAYWACACTVTVVPETGVVRCEKCTIAVDPGVIINPQQLKRQIEGGAVMGVSHAVLEELAFDQSGVTQDDWISYPILTMADIPEIQVVLINNPSTGTYGAGSEAANALAVPAIVAALHDATGKQMRRIPLKPAYVQELLKG
jgi:CO/xanthine dehydrogenase Mo-binding subunit